PRLPGAVVNRLRQLVASYRLDVHSRRRLALRVNLQQERSAGLQKCACVGKDALDRGEAVRAAVERQTRLEASHRRFELLAIGARNVRRIAGDEVERLTARQRQKQVALHEGNAIGDAVARRVALGDGERFRADVGGGELRALVVLRQGDGKDAG